AVEREGMSIRRRYYRAEDRATSRDRTRLLRYYGGCPSSSPSSDVRAPAPLLLGQVRFDRLVPALTHEGVALGVGVHRVRHQRDRNGAELIDEDDVSAGVGSFLNHRFDGRVVGVDRRIVLAGVRNQTADDQQSI